MAKKTEQIALRITPELKSKLEKVADKMTKELGMGIVVSQVVRTCIEKELPRLAERYEVDLEG